MELPRFPHVAQKLSVGLFRNPALDSRFVVFVDVTAIVSRSKSRLESA